MKSIEYLTSACSRRNHVLLYNINNIMFIYSDIITEECILDCFSFYRTYLSSCHSLTKLTWKVNACEVHVCVC